MLEDIEDIIGSSKAAKSLLEEEDERVSEKKRIIIPKRQRNKVKKEEDESPSDFIPGTQTVWVRTFGCSHNVSDGEYMQGLLSAYGYNVITKESLKQEADLWLVNSCTVKNPSEGAFLTVVRKARESKKGLVVSGCVPQGDRKHKELEGVSIVGTSQIDRVVEVVEETLKGNTVRLLSKKSLPRLDLPKVRKNPYVEIVPLSTGCLGACTYCKTRHARGKLGSYSLNAIVSRVKQVIEEGVTEIWLSSEDTGAWGIDLGLALPDLLKGVTEVLPKDQSVMLRLGMTNPPYMLEHLDHVADALNHPSVFAFLHVPVQSGSDAVLEAMNREYNVAEFEKVADTLLSKVPGMTLATDVICGFPGETDEDAKGTLDLLKKYKLPVVNISKFYPRRGTPAAAMKQLNSQIKKTRSREITKFFLSYQPYHKIMPPGTVCTAWVCSEVASDGKHSVAHTKSYVKVIFPRNDELIGGKVELKIVSCSKFHVEGELVRVFFKHRGFPCEDVAPKNEGKNKLNKKTSSEKLASKAQKAENVVFPLPWWGIVLSILAVLFAMVNGRNQFNFI